MREATKGIWTMPFFAVSFSILGITTCGSRVFQMIRYNSAIANIFFMVPKVYKSDAGKVDVNTHPLMPVHRFTVVNLDLLDDSVSAFGNWYDT